MIERIVIEAIRPSTPDRKHPAKASVSRGLHVSADIYREGHDVLWAAVRHRPAGSRRWTEVSMQEAQSDHWEASILAGSVGKHEFEIQAATDLFATWRKNVSAKFSDDQHIDVELSEGAILLESHLKHLDKRYQLAVREAIEDMRDTKARYAARFEAAMSVEVMAAFTARPLLADLTTSERLTLWVDRERAAFGSWYEFFPRSEGGLQGATKRLRAIADMGFDVVYLPPIHPIGKTDRKGRNNSLKAGPSDPGSPWAIGSEEGGHTDIDPSLGTIQDFDRMVEEARSLGMEIALDYALQCSRDHPWLKEHPKWFNHRPDGSIKYAENPPKKYQDIYPMNFWPEEGREDLWNACRQILEYWISHGVQIFRVDNPHTKPLAFWEWLICGVKNDHPDVLFLSEAFTRPRMMAKLAEVGFSQSYTYFTWRTNKHELTEYATELAYGPTSDFFRPNLWPNTPDILSGVLRNGNVSAFKSRLVLAATLSPNYGIYSGYELLENAPMSHDNEEYMSSEKYEIKTRDWDAPTSIAPLVTLMNDIRRRHQALQELSNIHFHWADDANIIVYSKTSGSDVMLMVVNLDPLAAHESTLWLDLDALGLPPDLAFEVLDEVTGHSFVWRGPAPYVRLDPAVEPAHVFHVRVPT
ncbi:MAG: alpha-1,4-glucan--maltose-1-phosphate maltosyltransferase [Actinomycetota bacterium]|nr:alpha-1,4-glucan--maltose-1-phosphate maltosyltransferase [Actinomycetota bacterium]